MSKKNSSPSAKTPRKGRHPRKKSEERQEEPLTITLDAEAAKIVRSLARGWKVSPADVASALIIGDGPRVTEAFRSKQDSIDDQWRPEYENAMQLALRRHQLWEAAIDRLDGPGKGMPVAPPLVMEFPMTTSWRIRELAKHGEVPPDVIVSVLLESGLEACMTDSFFAVDTVDEARDYHRKKTLEGK